MYDSYWMMLIQVFIVAGVLNQVGIVSGIFTGQCASLALSRQETWRFVPVITSGIAVLQILSGAAMEESPVWLSHKAHPSVEESENAFQDETDDGEHCSTIDRRAKANLLIVSIRCSRTPTIWRERSVRRRDSLPTRLQQTTSANNMGSYQVSTYSERSAHSGAYTDRTAG
jgi:hypothetical protein